MSASLHRKVMRKMAKNRMYRQILAILCIVLMLCAPSGVLLSLSHQCVDDDCLICSMVGGAKSILALLAICITFLIQSEYTGKKPGSGDSVLCLKDITLVLQKVKLTD